MNDDKNKITDPKDIEIEILEDESDIHDHPSLKRMQKLTKNPHQTYEQKEIMVFEDEGGIISE